MPVHARGAPLDSAKLVIVLLHGRGDSAADMLTLADHLDIPHSTYLAPQAATSSWYPASFMAPFEANQPGIDSAHDVIETLVQSVVGALPSPPPVALLGFSQGACLTVDHAYRFPRRYAFVAALTGGLIGPDGSDFEKRGSLNGTPVFLGASNPDPHVPWSRVEHSAAVLGGMDASVELRSYSNRPHAVLPEQVDRLKRLATCAVQGSGS